MPIHDIQTSFAGGEISPELSARVDLQKYKTGLKTLRNFIVSPSGSVYRRPGTYYVATCKYFNRRARLIPFVVSKDLAYVLEFGDNYIRFYKNGTQIMSGGVPYEIATPYAWQDLPLIKYAQSADTVYLAHGSYAPLILKFIGDANWTLTNYYSVNGPYRLGNSDASKVMSVSNDVSNTYLKANFDAFVPAQSGMLFQVTQQVQNGYIYAQRTSTGVFQYLTFRPPVQGGLRTEDVIVTENLICGGTWRFTSTGTWSGQIALQQSIDNGVTWEILQSFFSTSNTNYDTFGSVDTSTNNGQPVLIRLFLFAYVSGTPIVYLRTDPFTYNKPLVTLSYVDARHMLIAHGTSFLDTFLWAEGSWSNYRGWPSSVTFCQDRLVWGANKSEPQTAWTTKTGNYIDFGRTDPLIDSDGITVNMTSRQLNPIRNLVSFLNSLLSFTGLSEFSMSSNQGAALSPETVVVKLQGTRGSSDVPPVMIGNRVLFIEPMSSNVRDMAYQYLSDTFETENVSIFSNHLFYGYSIVDMAYQQEPDSLLWLVRSDGTLLCLTYLREQEMMAWSRHDTVGGFESICVVPSAGDAVTPPGDEVYFSVVRNGNRFVERMRRRTNSTNPRDQFYVDSGDFYVGDPSAILSRYSHLEGMSLAINANGFVKPPQTVSGGALSFDSAYSQVIAGVPYPSDIETLNPEFQVQGGTLQDRKYQISRVTLRFLNTVGGQAGPDLNTLDAVDVRDPSLDAGTPTPLFTGFVTLPMPRNDDQRGHVAYRQSDPMPSTILGIYPIVAPGENP